jgi:hypothetical protein
LIESLNYSGLFSAREELRHLIGHPRLLTWAEGEGVLGCRLDVERLKKWVSRLDSIIETRATRDRQLYLSDPARFSRANGFDQCAQRCQCGGLAQLLKSAPLKDLKSPEKRSLHRMYSRKLSIKAERQGHEETIACLNETHWICDSELRDFLDQPGTTTPARQ